MDLNTSEWFILRKHLADISVQREIGFTFLLYKAQPVYPKVAFKHLCFNDIKQSSNSFHKKSSLKKKGSFTLTTEDWVPVKRNGAHIMRCGWPAVKFLKSLTVLKMGVNLLLLGWKSGGQKRLGRAPSIYNSDGLSSWHRGETQRSNLHFTIPELPVHHILQFTHVASCKLRLLLYTVKSPQTYRMATLSITDLWKVLSLAGLLRPYRLKAVASFIE